MNDLLQIATPDVYRRNGFRILGLQVRAISRDVQRAVVRLQMEASLGLGTQAAPNSVLNLNPAPSANDLNGALTQLHQPIERFFAELFWFWPLNENDPALAALDQGHIELATAIWSKNAADGTKAEEAYHNLAVLYHMLALDDEQLLLTSPDDRKVAARLQTEWSRAFGYWRNALSEASFWTAVQRRARSNEDVRLTEAFVDELRAAFPGALLRINGRIAIAASERGDMAVIRRNLWAIYEAGFGGDSADDAANEMLRPAHDRMKKVIDATKARWNEKPQKANLFIRDMEAAGHKILVQIDAIISAIPTERAASVVNPRETLADAMADAMLTGQIAYTNKTNDWAEGINILERACALAAGTLRERLTKDIGILKGNAEAGNDWCAPGYWDLPEETIKKLEGAREKCRTGDFESALSGLVAMDPAIGRPLRRAIAYCLSISGIREYNEALSEYNQPTDMRKRLLDRIRNNVSIITRSPNPHAPSYTNPPCPSCESSSYTRWFNFKLMEGQLPVWWCAACNARDDRQIDEQKNVLRPHIASAMEFLQLASEVDPGERGVLRNLEIILKHGKNFNCALVGTAALKKRLGDRGPERNALPHIFKPIAEDAVCFFCASVPPDPACGIMLPVWGDAKTEQLLFSDRTTFRQGEIVVPRCRSCRDSHQQLERSLRKWDDDRVAASRSVPGVPKWLDLAAGYAPAIGGTTALASGIALQNGRAGLDLSPIASAVARGTDWSGVTLSHSLPVLVAVLFGVALACGVVRLRHRSSKKATERRAAADATFVRTTLKPALPDGTKGEESFAAFPRIASLRILGWNFGKDGTAPNVSGDDDLRIVASGLVTSFPGEGRRQTSPMPKG